MAPLSSTTRVFVLIAAATSTCWNVGLHAYNGTTTPSIDGFAQPPPNRSKVLHAYNGTTPSVDGFLEPGEWDDAFLWEGIYDWDPAFAPVIPATPQDLNLTIRVKRDGERLYFAMEVFDDLLYYFQTPHFMPGGNPYADNLTVQGFPWFGDEMEILLSTSNTWNSPNQTVQGNNSQWQMVCNLHKSRLGGLGIGGLLEGEPRSSPAAWATYQRWIEGGAQIAATSMTPDIVHGNNVYIFEWGIAFNPCVELPGNVYYNATTMKQPVQVSLNIALGDVDTAAEGDPTYGLRHEMWFSGQKGGHTYLSQFGTLWLEPGNNPAAALV